MQLKEGFIVCDNQVKLRILSNLKEFKRYMFISYKELIHKFYGYVKENAIFSLVSNYGISYDLAKEYMKYAPYTENKAYNDIKLDSLYKVKSFLEKEDLIEKDPYFIYQLKQYPITFLDIKETKEFEKLTSELSKTTEVILMPKETKNYQPKVSEYDTILDELYDICNQIKILHKKGIKYSNIYLMNMNSDYEFILKRLSESYNIPIAFKPNKNILHTRFVKDFLKLSMEKESFQDILKELNDSIFLKPLIQLITTYSLEDKKPIDYIDFFKKAFKSFSYEEKIYEDMVNISSSTIYEDNDYVFYLGLNQGISPKIYKDEEYLPDNLLEKLFLPTSIEKNKQERKNLISLIRNTKNLYLSYAIRKQTLELFPSSIIQELGLETIKKTPLYGYSKDEDMLRLSVLLSIFDKTKEENMALDYYDLSDIPYNTFDNKFKGIDKAHMIDRYKEEGSISLSYSTMKYYFECPFHYYAEKILDLSSYEDSIATRIGTYSHAILEDSYKDDFSFLDSSLKHKEEGIKDIDIKDAKKAKFYFEQMNEVLVNLIEYNKNHEALSSLNKVECEAHISYMEGNLKFHGFIDKLLYTEINGEIYAAIMDYKTGKDFITLDNVEDGFHLQLPSYMFLLSKYEKFKDKKIHIIGIYLQKVNLIALDNSKDIKEQREKSFKLQGFTILDKSLIPLLDPSYNKSDYIQSMATIKDGSFGKYAKVMDEEEENELIQLVDVFIHRVRDGIMDASFSISPKRINNKDQSCLFCPYKDLCFKTYGDYIHLKEKKFQDKEGE